MAQIILEIGQDSLRQYLFQNVLHLSIRSHQKSILSNYNTSNLLLNPPMGRFPFVSKRVNLRKQRTLRRRRRCHVQSPGSHLGVLCVCRQRKARGKLHSTRGRDVNTILLQLLTVPQNGSRRVPQVTPIRQDSVRRGRTSQLSDPVPVTLAAMTPQPTATYDSPN